MNWYLNLAWWWCCWYCHFWISHSHLLSGVGVSFLSFSDCWLEILILNFSILSSNTLRLNNFDLNILDRVVKTVESKLIVQKQRDWSLTDCQKNHNSLSISSSGENEENFASDCQNSDFLELNKKYMNHVVESDWEYSLFPFSEFSYSFTPSSLSSSDKTTLIMTSIVLWKTEQWYHWLMKSHSSLISSPILFKLSYILDLLWLCYIAMSFFSHIEHTDMISSYAQHLA